MTNKTDQDLAISTYVNLIRTAESLHATVSRGLTVEGLTASQFSTLKALKYKGALAQRDIAKYLLKTGGNVTVVVDNLEREGYVTRVRDTEDRRIVFVKLTRAGESLFDKIYPGHRQRIVDAVSPLNESEWVELAALLNKLNPIADVAACVPEPAMALS